MLILYFEKYYIFVIMKKIETGIIKFTGKKHLQYIKILDCNNKMHERKNDFLLN